MENASKALIIAGAILVSILIIGLGMAIYNKATGAVRDSNLDPEVVRQYNAGFVEYEGETNVKGANVKALIDNVMTHNRSVGTDTSLLIEVIEGTATDPNRVTASDAATVNAACKTIREGIQNGKTYTLTCGYDDTTGYVTQIGVQVMN